MKPATEIAIEIGAISVLNVLAVYIAAFVYHLNWWGILSVMVVSSLLTAFLSHIFVSKVRAKNQIPDSVYINEDSSVIIITLATSLAVLIILAFHFNLPMALGISLLSGIETVFWKKILFGTDGFITNYLS